MSSREDRAFYSTDRGRTTMRVMQRFVKLLDVIAVTLIFALCWYSFYADRTAAPFYRVGNWVVIGLFLVLYYMFARLYNGFLIHICRISELVYSQFLAVLITDFLLYVVISLLMKRLPNVLPMLLALGLQVLVILVWSVLSHKWYFHTFPRKKTVIVWETRRGLQRMMTEYGLDDHFEVIAKPSAKECVREQLVSLEGAEVVFLYGVHTAERNKINKYCILHGIQVYVIPRVGDVIMSAAQAIPMFHLPMLFVERYNPTPEYLFLKRLMDVVLSAMALVILSPVMIITAIIIKATDGGTVFYRQTRLTKNGRQFEVLKFRSMRMDAEKDGVARLSTGEHDDRITPVGHVIRAVRIDELPQLLNILKGDMSIVGPRPERPEIALQYERELPEFELRLQAKAGLTGYAQVYGKYNTTPYDKLLMDLMYIARPSIAEDLKIMFATVKILFLPESTEGIAEGQTTAGDGEKIKAAR